MDSPDFGRTVEIAVRGLTACDVRAQAEEIAAGVVATAALALIIDALLVLLGRLLMPWHRGRKEGRP